MSDSMWKKEISFKRKPKGDVEPAAEQSEPPVEKQSFWKKELSLSRKGKDDDSWETPTAPKQSFWKKELSLSRKEKESEVERLAQEAVRAVTPGPIGAPQPHPQPTELAEAVVAAMPDPIAPTPVEPAPVALTPAEVAPAEPIEPAASVPSIHAVADPTPETPAVASWAEPPAPLPGETWLAAAQLPPVPEPVAAPVAPSTPVVHPPVPAAELPPLLQPAEKKTPFWKKELTLSRGAKAPKPVREPKVREPKVKGAPFWKKELSLGRKSSAMAAATEAATEQLPAAKAAPFWKRDLSIFKPKLSSGRAKGGHKVKRLVGLKIGASQLAAARISNNGAAELQQIAREPLANGVVVGGELRDPEALGAALKIFFARHKLPRKNVRLGIASNRIGVRIIDIVGVEEEKQLANAVQFRAQEALPIPLDEAVLDYRVLEESVDDEGRKVQRVLLVVAYRELIDRYVIACRKAGITLAGIDLEAFALLRALGAPSDRGASALVAVAIGHDRSTFAVSDGRICEFTRVVEWGGSSLNIALARIFDSTPSEVEPIKRQLSLDGSTTPEDLSPEQAALALETVRRQVQSFARELVSSLQFYQNQPGSLGIGEIVLTGGTTHLPGLAEELERLIGVHVLVGDPLARLKIPKRFAKLEQVGSLAVAIGLGIED
jgi:type IV pilus assembly protein PilM